LETIDFELLIWEADQLAKEQERYEPSKTRRAFDPCKERLFKRRRHWWHTSIESPSDKKMWQRYVRAKSRNIEEESHHPTPHEYHTYGRLSW
jgi:hypothetical protein